MTVKHWWSWREWSLGLGHYHGTIVLQFRLDLGPWHLIVFYRRGE